MLLAIDVGNTNITFGIFKDDILSKKFDIPTRDYTLGKLKKKIGKMQFDDIIICSVVPGTTGILKKGLKKIAKKNPICLGRDLVAPIKNRYRNPKEVGQDRLVNAYAGVIVYGAPLLVVDFGTAITFDVISRKKEYLGGIILPGLSISLGALNRHAALLPKINLARPAEFIGRDTKNSMLSGVVYGFAALTDELIRKIKDKIGKSARVIGTGGNIDLIGKYCKAIDKIDSELTLKGINLIYKERQSNY